MTGPANSSQMLKSFALLLALCGVVAPAVQAKMQTAPVPASADLPLRIAELFVPREALLQKTGEAFDRSVAASAATDPESAAMEKQFPGVTNAARIAGREVLLKALEAQVSDLQAQSAAIFRDDLDYVEQSELYTFLASPLGRKIVAMGDQVYKTKDIVKDLQANPGKPALTGQDLANAVDPSFLNKLSPQEVDEATKFAETAGGTKFTAITPKLQQLAASWTNQMVASQMPLVREAAINAVRDYIAKAKGKS